MKQIICKYPLNKYCAGTLLALPGDFKILHIRRIEEKVFIWIQHSPIEKPLLKNGVLVDDLRNFEINVIYRGTDWMWDADDFGDNYIGSVPEDECNTMEHYFYEFVT